jgi:hypothetical protein
VKWLSLDYLVFNTNLLWDCIYLSWILISLWEYIHEIFISVFHRFATWGISFIWSGATKIRR